MNRFLSWAMALNFMRFGEGIKRTSWPVGKYVYMDKTGVLLDQTGALYTPSKADKKATDWRQA